MKTLKTLTALLLMIINTACYAFEHGNGVKVVISKTRAEKSVKIIYRGKEAGKVTVSLFGGEWLLYHEVYKRRSFIQRYDLSNLSEGNYTFDIKTPKGRTKKTIRITPSGICEAEKEKLRSCKFSVVGKERLPLWR